MLKRIFIALSIVTSISVYSKETRKVIAVIDTGMPSTPSIKKYLCTDGHRDFTGIGIRDVHGHGTNIVGLIIKGMNPKTHCIVILKFYHDQTVNNVSAYSSYLWKLKPSMINMSLAGPEFNPLEYSVLKALTQAGTVVVVAAGNDRQDLSIDCNTYPACYKLGSKNFHVVGAPDLAASNYNGPVTDLDRGLYQCALNVCFSGSSQATANVTAKLLKDSK